MGIDVPKNTSGARDTLGSAIKKKLSRGLSRGVSHDNVADKMRRMSSKVVPAT